MSDFEPVIEHMGSNGTVFSCETKDLSTVVRVNNQWINDPIAIGADYMEFGAWHSMEIRETLKSFQGYDTIEYEMVEK